MHHDLQFVPQRDRRVVLDGDPQRDSEQLWAGGQIALDDAPEHRVVHVVEQIDVGEPDRVFADLVGILAVPGRKVGRPTETVDVSGALQPFQEALADAGRHQGGAVDVDPERLGLD